MPNRKTISIIVCVLFSASIIFGSAGCSSSKDNNAIQNETTQNEVIQNETTQNQTDEKFEPISEKERKTITVDWKPIAYEKKVKPYKVNSDLSNIVNLDQFGAFTPQQKEALAKNSFFVSPAEDEQLFYIYENNQYLKMPSFVTTDSVLQVYHVFYDFSLRTLENDKLLGELEKLTDDMLNKSINLYNQVQNLRVKAAALKNVAYFAVAQKALGKELPEGIPGEAKKLAEAEYKLIVDQGGFKDSPIFSFKQDYSQYKPRGHYTRNDNLKKYFTAMMWYGQAPFPLYKIKDGKPQKNIDQTIQALLITFSTFLNYNNRSDADLWETIYDPTTFYIGDADDLNIYHYKDLLIKVYGDKPDLERLDEAQKIEELFKEAEKLPQPKIQPAWVTVDTPTGAQFRFMGQRYIPDSEILQNIIEPYQRPMPKGLDVMGVLGSDRAYDLLINKYKENENWPQYTEKFAELKDQFSKVSDKTWQSNMYYGWLWTLKSLLPGFGSGYPTFMTNKAWQDKSLSTALGSWTELRHDTILYAKQSGAECGGDGPPPVVRSYVEPNIEVYQKLLWLTKYSHTNLKERNIITSEVDSSMKNLEDLLQFLINCSIKELRNEELTQEEYYQLLIYGGTLEHLSTRLAGGYKGWYEIQSETDRNMALVADIHTASGSYLEEAVGPAAQIFVVVPVGGKLYLTRGAVFSYYEFVSNNRLTDEEWQKMFKEKKQPPLPDWTDSFIMGVKDQIPTPTEPYNSGC